MLGHMACLRASACSGGSPAIANRRLPLLPPAHRAPADDSAAFQAAIDAAVAAAGPGNGKAVLIPPGTYEIRQTVSIGGSNVVLRGSGVSARAGCMLRGWERAGQRGIAEALATARRSWASGLPQACGCRPACPLAQACPAASSPRHASLSLSGGPDNPVHASRAQGGLWHSQGLGLCGRLRGVRSAAAVLSACCRCRA